MIKRLMCAVLAILMIVSLVPAVFASGPADFPDMPGKESWSYNALCAAIENGLLNGSGGKLLPGANLTRAQMAAIVNRAFGSIATADVSGFKDVKTTDWFYNDIAKALRMGTFVGSGGGMMNPNDPISREQAFTVVARALKLESEDESALDRFSDASKISAWARGPVAAMAAAGYVNGSGGKINPTATITREEFAQVFYNIIKKYVKTAGVFSEDVAGNLIVNVPGVTLSNMKIEGDLIIGEGVDSGEVILDNVEITGRMLVRGGGVNSVIIKNNTAVGSVLISKTGDGGVRVRTEEGCTVGIVVVDDGRDEIILEGGMNQVVIDTDTPVVIRDGDVTGLTVKAADANVTVGADVSIMSVAITDTADGTELSVDENATIAYLKTEAEGAGIRGDGKINIADVSGNGTTFDVEGASLTVSEGTTGVVECGNEVEAGDTVITGKDSHEHVWDEGFVSKAPTCTEEGERTFTCECGETKTEPIPASGHKPAAAVKENENGPTCTAAGSYDEVVRCSICSAELSRTAKTVGALGHDWDNGVTVVEATEENEGLIRYTCSRCKETREENVPKIGHVHKWNEGVETKEPTFFEPGEITYTCQGCGAKRTEKIDPLPPYAVFTDDGPVLFDTLEEAIAEASKHPYHNDPGEDEWTEYSILLLGPDKLENLVLESGYNLVVFGHLEVEGDIVLGASDYAFCPGAGAARLIISMEEGVLFSVGGKTVFDGDAPENGSFRMVSDNSEGSVRLTITGLRRENANGDPDGESVYGQPFLCLEGNPDDYDSVDIIGDADFTSWTDGFMIEDNFDEVRLESGLSVDEFFSWSTPLDFCGDGASFTLSGKKYLGTSSDAAFRMIDDGGAAVWASIDNDGNVHVTGSEACVNGPLEIAGYFDAASPLGSEGEFVITVTENSSFTLTGEAHLNENVRLVNNGTFRTSECYLEVYGAVENNNEFITSLHEREDGEFTSSTTEFLAGSSLINRGAFIVDGRETDDGSRFCDVYFDGATFINEESASIENLGMIYVEGGTFENNGLIETKNNFDLRSGFNRVFEITGDEDAGWTENGAGYLEARNGEKGVIHNKGFFNVSGSRFINDGTFINYDGQFYAHSAGAFTIFNTLERISGNPESGEDWEKFFGWDNGHEGYLRYADQRYEAETIFSGELINRGTFINLANAGFSGAVLDNSGNFGNAGQINVNAMSMDNYDGDSEHVIFPDDIEFPITRISNSGIFGNGMRTNVGEGWTGSDAWINIEGSYFENSNNVVNNGQFRFCGSDYVAAAGSSLVTYNSSGLDITGGSLTVPADCDFLNEGYLRITDEYGKEAKYGKCDLSGFENFFTDWLDESNDSRWLDYSARTYDLEGYYDAVLEQSGREGRYRYNRLDFCGDVTFTEDEVFDDFDSYWIECKTVEGWVEYTDHGPIPVDGPCENGGIETYDAGVTLTVAEGATLTVANEHNLVVEGCDYGEWEVTLPGMLKVDGTLVIAETIPEQWNEQGERISDNIGEGRVEVWMDGSFDAGDGEVINGGYFEVRYHENCHFEDDGYVNDGGFFRPEGTVLIGVPDNYIPCAEVRTSEGFAEAIGYVDPVFLRICPRYDSCVTVRDDLTLGEGVQLSIEGNSGMIVEHGATFTVSRNAYVDNHGDVTVFGDLIIEGNFWSDRGVEVGAVTGSEEANIIIRGNGYLETRGGNPVAVYETGKIVLEDRGRICSDGEPVTVTAAENWMPDGSVRGVRFEDNLEIRAEGGHVYFEPENCVFDGGINVVIGDETGSFHLESRGENVFGPDTLVVVCADYETNFEELNGRVEFQNADGFEILAFCPVRVWFDDWAEGTVDLSGMTVTKENRGWADIAFFFFGEPKEGTLVINGDFEATLTFGGKLPDNVKSINAESGTVDLTGLEYEDGVTVLSSPNEERFVDVKNGSRDILVNFFDKPTGFAGIYADDGAVITVENMKIGYDEGWFSNGLSVTANGESFDITPHVFGLGNNPAIYIGVSDDRIGFKVLKDGAELEFNTEYIDNEDEHKTHLSSKEGCDWFEASEEYDPHITLEITLPGGVTVTVNGVPLKPEWIPGVLDN